MAHDFLIYDFGTDEETAQSARRKVEGWAQSYRLGKKLTFKFDREEPAGNDDIEEQLDEALDESFPASDPPAVGKSS